MPDKTQDGYDENSTKRFGEYLHDTAIAASLARNMEEAMVQLQALANHETLHIVAREAANIGMSTDEVENAVSILANQTPRPTIRMIRFRKE